MNFSKKIIMKTGLTMLTISLISSGIMHLKEKNSDKFHYGKAFEIDEFYYDEIHQYIHTKYNFENPIENYEILKNADIPKYTLEWTSFVEIDGNMQKRVYVFEILNYNLHKTEYRSLVEKEAEYGHLKYTDNLVYIPELSYTENIGLSAGHVDEYKIIETTTVRGSVAILQTTEDNVAESAVLVLQTAAAAMMLYGILKEEKVREKKL